MIAALPSWLAMAGAVAAGFVSGVLSAMMGIGGAVVTTPAVRALGGTPIEAVGSTIPAILPGAISGAWRYARAGLVQWRLALPLGVAGSVLAVVGARLSDEVSGRILMVLTASVMLWSGLTVVGKVRGSDGDGADPEPTAQAVAARDSLALLGLAGATAGFVAGLLGVGGGIVLVPVLTGVLHLPMRRAVASSLVGVAIFQVPALVTHVWLGHVNWTYALPLMLGALPGAQVGAHITIRTTDRTVRIGFGALIVVLAVAYGASEIRGIVQHGW
jgi:uncharacterized membrane protein YfcA